jgi:general secretion pathway protein G
MAHLTPSGRTPWRAGASALPPGSFPARRVTWARARRGFTLIEMMIVMAIIVILIAIAIPYYQKSIQRAKETVLHANLEAIRQSIDEYGFDKQKAPQTLDDLVKAGYLHDVPRDPIAQTNDWKIIQEDPGQAVDSSQPGIFDIRSTSSKIGLDGTHYSDW